jgi:hypothetical protein
MPVRHYALLAAIACIAGGAHAADECPLIRPPGLSAQQVDAAVLAIYAQALRTDPRKIDTDKTVKSLDGTENAILTYSFATLSVGEALGFDAVRAFFDAAKAKGGAQPFDTLSMAEIQSLARAAYERGVDSEPPLAKAEAMYKVHSLRVRPPQPVGDWRLVQCGGEYVAFRRQSPTGTSTAGVRVAALPRYSSESSFLGLVSSMLSTSVPTGYVARPWKPVAVASPEAPCADANVVAEASDGTPMFVRSRICYASPGANFGYSIMFVHRAVKGGEAPGSEAEAFVRSVGAK